MPQGGSQGGMDWSLGLANKLAHIGWINNEVLHSIETMFNAMMRPYGKKTAENICITESLGSVAEINTFSLKNNIHKIQCF